MIKISEKRLLQLKKNFKEKRIAVIGDMMLDIYFWGDVKRISPEAPVPVLEVECASCASVQLIYSLAYLIWQWLSPFQFEPLLIKSS